MFNITTRLEVNIQGVAAGADINGLSTFVSKNKIPVIVSDPAYIEGVLVERSKFLGQYQVICTVDFPNGKHFASEKMRDLPKAAMLADGFDIMVSAKKTDRESLNELRAISDFILKYVDPTKEIRWVLGLRHREYDDVRNMMSHFKNCPAKFIRTDNHLVLPKIDINSHLLDIEFIKSSVAIPIKLSGNITLTTINETINAVSRYDVSVQQAKEIIKELKSYQAETRGSTKVAPKAINPVTPISDK
jgi:deoxyribose-phosphate aldolase